MVGGTLFSRLLFWSHGQRFKCVRSRGIPILLINRHGFFSVGNELVLNNTVLSNPIGRVQRCIFFVGRTAELRIGNAVGISSATIVCKKEITIGDHVLIGGGVCIYDTDFHALSPVLRSDVKSDTSAAQARPVVIQDHVFIGAHSVILKGVTIGRNSIVGAGSVVSHSIPEGEIWGGNPARFLKKVPTETQQP